MALPGPAPSTASARGCCANTPASIGLDPAFTIHDREDSADLMNLVRHELGLFEQTESRFPLKGTCLAIYSRAVKPQTPLAEVLQTTFPWCAEWEAELKALFRGLCRGQAGAATCSITTICCSTGRRWSRDPALAREIGARFDHVLVDEYQDTNRLQAAILLALKPDGRGLTVVGDDAQSIYSFRGATVRNILDFPGHFSPPAGVITLERNYRSTQPILAAANAVIALASERFSQEPVDRRAARPDEPQLVTVRDEADQADYVVERVLEQREAGMQAEAAGGAVPHRPLTAAGWRSN